MFVRTLNQFVEVLIDSTGTISQCHALNEIGANCENEIVKIFREIPGKWSPADISLEKRLIFPVELRVGDISKDYGDIEIRLPIGKLMNKIVITAY